MGQYTTEALVLGVRNWGDADKMVMLLSRERGKIKAAAFGCRRPRSPLAGGMQMFNHLDVQLSEGQRIDTIRQCMLRENFRTLCDDFMAMAYGAFIAELVLELLPEHEAQPDLFDRLLMIFRSFGTRNPRLQALAAACQLLEFSGVQLHFSHCVRCGRLVDGDGWFAQEEGGVLCQSCGCEGDVVFPSALREFILRLLQLDWQGPPAFRVRKTELLQAEQLILGYIQQLLGKPLKSLAFIRQAVCPR